MTGSPRERRWRPGGLSPGFGWIWVATAVLFAASALLAPGTVEASSLLAMLPFAAMLAMVAVGQTLVIQQRGLDLSAGAMMSLSGMVAATLGQASGSMLLSVLATLGIALLLGAFNGLLVARLNIMPIVATLASGALFTGAVHTLSGGSPMAVGESLAAFSHQRWFGLPATAILVAVFTLLMSIGMSRSLTGRRFTAVGDNPRAAAASGLAVLRYQIGAYAAAAGCFGVAGVVYAGFLGSASHTAGDNYLLPAIAAVVVGGTSLVGGRGSVMASGVAALFMAQLGQLVLALGASAAVQLLVQAAAILAASLLRHGPGWVRLLRPRRVRREQERRLHT